MFELKRATLILKSESREVKVVRCYVGHLMTSLEMRGIQLSVLRVDGDERSWWLSLLDAPTSAPMWPHPLYHDRITPEKLSDDGDHWDHFKVKFFIIGFNPEFKCNYHFHPASRTQVKRKRSTSFKDCHSRCRQCFGIQCRSSERIGFRLRRWRLRFHSQPMGRWCAISTRYLASLSFIIIDVFCSSCAPD